MTGRTPFRALMASGAQLAQVGSLMKLLINGKIAATDVCTDLALELAIIPTGSRVDVGLVTGSNGSGVEVPEGADVMGALLAVEDGSPDDVEAGDAEFELTEDPAEVIELEPRPEEEAPTTTPVEEGSGQ